jgi:hypothetical protein
MILFQAERKLNIEIVDKAEYIMAALHDDISGNR